MSSKPKQNQKKQPAKKAKTIRGTASGKGLKIAVITAEFNEYFTDKLLEGALDTFQRSGVSLSEVQVVKVPGAFEIPLVVQKLLAKKKFDAMIALGVVIRGETRHFNHVVDAASEGIMQATLEANIPVINAVIAAENTEQAIARSGGKLGNKGRDAAKAAIEMANLMKEIE